MDTLIEVSIPQSGFLVVTPTFPPFLILLFQGFCIAPDGLLNGAESLFRPLTDSNL
jgi:hypothetical protein